MTQGPWRLHVWDRMGNIKDPDDESAALPSSKVCIYRERRWTREFTNDDGLRQVRLGPVISREQRPWKGSLA